MSLLLLKILDHGKGSGFMIVPAEHHPVGTWLKVVALALAVFLQIHHPVLFPLGFHLVKCACPRLLAY